MVGEQLEGLLTDVFDGVPPPPPVRTASPGPTVEVSLPVRHLAGAREDVEDLLLPVVQVVADGAARGQPQPRKEAHLPFISSLRKTWRISTAPFPSRIRSRTSFSMSAFFLIMGSFLEGG